MKEVVNTAPGNEVVIPPAGLMLSCGACGVVFITDEYSIMTDETDGSDAYYDNCPACGVLNRARDEEEGA